MKKIIILSIVFGFAISTSKSQSIPNSNFENWSNSNGYSIPDNWDNLNPTTAFDGVFTCMKGAPGNPGSSHLRLVSLTVNGMGVMPGIAVCGKLDQISKKPISGFAFNQRPTALTGNWQFMAASAEDAGLIEVYFTKWNSINNARDTIGMGIAELGGMEMEWATFSILISYTNSDNPDSCIISLNASGNMPEEYSFLYIDNLEFAGITGIQNQENIGVYSVYPNPANEYLNLDLTGLKTVVETIEIVDLFGKTVWSQKSDISFKGVIPIHQLSKGNYFLKIRTQAGIITRKFNAQ